MNSAEIIAYTYRADIYCPKCIIKELAKRNPISPAGFDMPVEDVLNQVAGANGIDRGDEATYDSDDFPKVVFAVYLEPSEVCGNCGNNLSGYDMLVIREGASQRTADEGAAVFISDSADLLKVELDDATKNLIDFTGWLDNPDAEEALFDLVTEWEGRLADAGFVAVWDDGYIIYGRKP